MDIDKTMLRDIHLAFIKMHILYHAAKEEVFGIGLIKELKRHGYKLSPGTLYPTLAKMQQSGLLTCECRTVQHKQRKYYRITRAGEELLDEVKEKLKELYDEIVKKMTNRFTFIFKNSHPIIFVDRIRFEIYSILEIYKILL